MSLTPQTFRTAGDFLEAIRQAREPDTNAIALARARQTQLTKPPGSLGRLEELAIWLAGWQGCERPIINNVQIIVFAGNHGITARGVSPYPSDVTSQMVANFQAGGAAINAIANASGFELDVIPLDLDKPVKDWTTQPAMSVEECLAALNKGASAIEDNTDLLVLGEMGIGNTTSASALCAAVFGGTGSDWAGPGTGLDNAGVKLKATVIDEGLTLHNSDAPDGFEILRRLGGRELAAIAGAIVAARQRRLPVVLDGFVATAAATTLHKENKNALAHCVAGHVSAEPAHQKSLEKLCIKPLLDLSMRLGEGSGAALAANIVRVAAATHSNMATFDEAGVSNREDKP